MSFLQPIAFPRLLLFPWFFTASSFEPGTGPLGFHLTIPFFLEKYLFSRNHLLFPRSKGHLLYVFLLGLPGALILTFFIRSYRDLWELPRLLQSPVTMIELSFLSTELGKFQQRPSLTNMILRMKSFGSVSYVFLRIRNPRDQWKIRVTLSLPWILLLPYLPQQVPPYCLDSVQENYYHMEQMLCILRSWRLKSIICKSMGNFQYQDFISHTFDLNHSAQVDHF